MGADGGQVPGRRRPGGGDLAGVGVAAMVGVLAYFCCAAVAHLRAGFTGQSFWLNCLGMLALTVAMLVLTRVL